MREERESSTDRIGYFYLPYDSVFRHVLLDRSVDVFVRELMKIASQGVASEGSVVPINEFSRAWDSKEGDMSSPPGKSMCVLSGGERRG